MMREPEQIRKPKKEMMGRMDRERKIAKKSCLSVV